VFTELGSVISKSPAKRILHISQGYLVWWKVGTYRSYRVIGPD